MGAGLNRLTKGGGNEWLSQTGALDGEQVIGLNVEGVVDEHISHPLDPWIEHIRLLVP
jgi:hypothetical protein